MKVLYFYAEVMGYTLSTIRELVCAGAELKVVHWDHKKLTPFSFGSFDGVDFHPRSNMSRSDLCALANEFDPDITVVSGWQDIDYLYASFLLRLKGKIVVTCFDDQISKSLKQRIGRLLSLLRPLQLFFSHAWVAGPFQFEYARRFGFKNSEIIFDFVSADLDTFSEINQTERARKPANKRAFLFIGRFETSKGILTLLDAWRDLSGEHSHWKLIFIGNGALEPTMRGALNVEVRPFTHPTGLPKVAAECDCFILPSLFEPWGVVVHEMAALAMPMILSDKVGAGATFLIDGFNGYRVKAGCAADLKRAMTQVILECDSRAIEMGKVSKLLSTRITPQTSASNLLSLLT
jgi:glycosyltransferase involved in cell wall biosynthesis